MIYLWRLGEKLLKSFFKLLTEIYLLMSHKWKFLPQLVSKDENKDYSLGLVSYPF